MSQIITTVPFHGDSIVAVETPEGVYVPVRPICERLGVSRQGQSQRLTRPDRPWGSKHIMLPSGGGEQETLCIPVNRVAAWLMLINPAKVHPEHRDALIRYQSEAADVLDRHFRLRAQEQESELARAEERMAALRQFVLAERPLWSKIDRYHSLGYPAALIADLVGRGAPQVERIVGMLIANGVIERRTRMRAYNEPPSGYLEG